MYSKLCLNDSGRYHEVGCVYCIHLYKVLRIILRNEIYQNRFFSIDSGMRRPQTSAVIMLSSMWCQWRYQHVILHMNNIPMSHDSQLMWIHSMRVYLKKMNHSCTSHTIHVWYIYLHLVDFYGKCREICQSHGWYGLWFRLLEPFFCFRVFLNKSPDSDPSERSRYTPRGRGRFPGGRVPGNSQNHRSGKLPYPPGN